MLHLTTILPTRSYLVLLPMFLCILSPKRAHIIINNNINNSILYVALNIIDKDREVQLCASSGPWYFYVESLSAQDLLITADMGNYNFFPS